VIDVVDGLLLLFVVIIIVLLLLLSDWLVIVVCVCDYFDAIVVVLFRCYCY
jgi:hypothetical protein